VTSPFLGYAGWPEKVSHFNNNHSIVLKTANEATFLINFEYI